MLKVAMTYATECKKSTANKKKTLLDFKEINVSKEMEVNKHEK